MREGACRRFWIGNDLWGRLFRVGVMRFGFVKLIPVAGAGRIPFLLYMYP